MHAVELSEQVIIPDDFVTNFYKHPGDSDSDLIYNPTVHLHGHPHDRVMAGALARVSR